jgi:RNA polymerase sigma factor (sigma-70 family)
MKMDDAQLVRAARAGDRAAFAALYDRYGDRLHDFCYSILRDRDDAADAMHDAFLIAADELGRLRQPARARAWLYAIARHEALRRAPPGGRLVPADAVDVASLPEDGPDRGPGAQERRDLVVTATAGLSARDRALLDLHLRHGLEGEELASAAGVPVSHLYVTLTRLRDQVERSLGARLGGRPTTFDPLALLATVPMVPAPSHLREQLLSKLDRIGSVSSMPRLDSDGFPHGRSRRPRWIGVAAAALVLAIALVVLLAPDPSKRAVAGRTTTTTPEAVPSTAPTTTVTTTTTTSTTVPTVAPGRLVVATSPLDFETTGVLRQLRLRNTGGQPVIWGAAATVEWLRVAPRSGGIAGGKDVLVGVTLDRAKAPEGPFLVVISVTGADGVVSVPMTGSVDRGPVISAEGTDAVLLYARGGPCEPELTTVSAIVTDGLGVASVVLGWRTSDAQEHTATMVPIGDGAWRGELGPFVVDGDVEWWISATDTGGNDARTKNHVLPVVPCAAPP